MEYSPGGRTAMTDLTWYSREGADQRFLTKSEAASLASKEESSQGDATLGSRIDAVKATAEAALPSSTASSTYATKTEVEAVKQSIPQVPAAPDLSGYATKVEMQAADTSLGQRIDTISGVATSAATKAELTQYATTSAVASTYATKESLAGYLTASDAESTYATKAQLAQAQLGGNQNAPDLSGLATKAEMRQADSGLGARIDQVKATADAALSTTTAASTYATKADVASADSALEKRLDAVKKTADAALSTPTAAALYATKAEVSAARSIAEGALPKTEAATKYASKTDLSGYLTSTAAESTYATKAQTAGMGESIRAARALADAALPKAEAATTYATKSDLASVRSAIPTVPPAPDLAPYLKTADADGRYASKADLAKAQVGGNVDLSSYLTRDDAYSTFVQNQNLERELAQRASLEDVNAVTRRVDVLSKTITPFNPGERYYSPVTYFWPDYYEDGKPGKTSKWAQILKFAGSLGIVILNRNSGNWDEFNVDFQKQAQLALAAGAKRAVFYVKTQYLAATLPAGDPGRNNVPNVDKYTEDYIFGQIAKAKSQYGDVCQGVFLDETINGWGAQAGRVPAYKRLIDRIRTAYGKDFLIVINSGSNISQDMCKLDFDVCMMFEKDAASFLVEDPGTPILPDHMKQYPSTRWWAVVHGVTSENYKSVFDKADKLGIAHLYITDGQLREDPQRGGQWEPVGNPYANPPSQHILDLVVPWLKGYLPLKLEVDELRTRPKVLSLGKREAVPAGTLSGTIIVRKDA
uniref:Spherulation-specific family 4 n=1 Tax=Myoviridae sp. cte0t5 TaxID=2823549 RepID=A0A8S5LH97_9CAUD|nr:MAG TPA: spherulation-specific family 4 [Myoviridae sp. cte0t5]